MEKSLPTTKCRACPLRHSEYFRDFNPDQLAFMSDFKSGELNVAAGTSILTEGFRNANLFTIQSGWAFRSKTLPDGRRQIMNFMVPGDLLGLQGSMFDEMQHTVEALSAVRLCVFERRRLAEIYTQHPTLAFDITWLAAQEERILDENLLSVGRRSALERAAYLLAFLYQRGKNAGMVGDGRMTMPITQQHVADTLGLSIVHTNKTLRKLADRKLVRWGERGYEILDEARLMELSGWEGLPEIERPFL
ncbi:Crp/Fnr family transcriptional regulator [Pseudohoeflea coraliihabitans]|uniref:Crp/Fnr family transcriptional regulator n=1 Tax=Pseudohoeflea coraliihabitans TaxID=2860393 RepID=A0ABS6WPG7_9HYPH|nr:Crp/Fnr family transcriptional regulator [Pseudohoeflea sp. DP4N28-3]MBW3097287.1 Crp/Fnr family transcriptional regulator [Pseudohoeflea sp. DP4N28-3]